MTSKVRGIEGIKEATYNIAGTDVKVAVASGLSNARKLMDKIKSGEADYHFRDYVLSRRMRKWRRTTHKNSRRAQHHEHPWLESKGYL